MLPTPGTCLRHGCAAIVAVALASHLHLARASDAANPIVVRPSNVVARLHRPDVAAKARALSELAGRRDPVAIARALGDIESDTSLDPIARDHLLDTGLNALAALEPVDAARDVVARLETRKPTIWTALADGYGAQLVPLIDPGATARWVAARWEIADVRAAALTALRTGNTAVLDSLVRLDGRSNAVIGLREALATVGADTLAGWRESFHAALKHTPASGELALMVARRLNDPDLAAEVLANAPDSVAGEAVRWIATTPELGARSSLLEEALGRPSVASEACFALARLADAGDPAARARLLTLLGDDARGGSAAAALARLADPTLTQDLSERLDPWYPALVRQRAVLALGMSHTARARAVLERFAAEARDDDPARSSALAWLGTP